MAKPELTSQHRHADSDDPYEKEFRRKSVWRSFMGALYSAVGGAAFFAVFSTTATAVMAGKGLLAVMAGGGPLILLAAGAIAIYLAQREFTELACLRDDRLARHNAQAMGQTPPAPAKAQTVEPQVAAATEPDRRFAENLTPRNPAAAIAANAPKEAFAEAALASKAAGVIAR